MPLPVGWVPGAGLGNGGWVVPPVAITADIVDHDELDTDHRREGAYFGMDAGDEGRPRPGPGGEHGGRAFR
jgi:hypothetical protein